MPRPNANTRWTDPQRDASQARSEQHTLPTEASPDSQGCTANAVLPMRKEEGAEQAQDEGNAESKQEKPRLTIRQIREAAQKEGLAGRATRQAQESEQTRDLGPTKKKPSLLGGLFQVREPTQIALNQVAAQIMAQHGSTSATKVPNVRLEKMPDFVPKVNTKWDGIPESIKQKEKKDKEKAQSRGVKNDLFFSDSQFRGHDGMKGRSATLSSRHSSSTSSSIGTQGYSSGSQTNSGQTRFYTQSVNSSGDLASQQRPLPPAISEASGSTSASSLAEGVDEMPSAPDGLISSPPPSGQSGSRSEDGAPRSMSSIPAGKLHRQRSLRSYATPSLDTVPAHSTSPILTPQEASPTSPLPNETMVSTSGANITSNPKVSLTSSGPGVLGPPATVRRKPQMRVHDPFLAGEAQELVLPDKEKLPRQADLPLRDRESGRKAPSCGTPAGSRIQQDLEKRPDTSRARLGLSASMVFREEGAPWESQEAAQPSPSPRPPGPPGSSGPKSKFPKSFGLFNKEKDKNSG